LHSKDNSDTPDNSTTNVVAIFESPIDCLSHQTLCKQGFIQPFDGWHLSLGGTSILALEHFLQQHPNIKHCIICTDADEAGEKVAAKIAELSGMTTLRSSAGFFERRKMNKEIANLENKRSDYQKDTKKKYGTTWQLESEKSKLLKEKTQIENATGVTAAREAEQQRKRDAVIQQQQGRDRYNAERKAKRLENPSVCKDDPR